MIANRTDRLMLLLIVQGACVGLACAQGGTATWALPQSGDWSDSSNWVGDVVPGGPGATDIRVVVDLPGSYTISLDFDASVAGLELTGPGAQLSLTAPGTNLRTTGDNLFTGANIQGGQNTSIITTGVSVFNGGATISGIGSFNLGGMVEFTGGDDIDLCDTCVAINADGVWSGASTFNLAGSVMGSDIEIGTSGSLSLVGSGDRMIRGSGINSQFIIWGMLNVSLDSAADALVLDGADFMNRSGGMVRMETGTLRSNLQGTLSGNSLRGGDWFIGDAGTVDAAGVSIEGIDVSVELSGSGSSFAALDTLKQITGRGTLRLINGRDFAAVGADGFEVGGMLDVGDGSVFTANSGLSNLDAGTLEGGKFIVGGELKLMQGGGIETLNAELTLAGTGVIRDDQGGDLLEALADIRDDGALELRDGAAFTTAGDLTLTGRLELGAGTNMDIRGNLDSFQAGVFGSADLRVRGDLLADNARVETVAGRLVVGLRGRLLARDGAGTIDGMLFLREIAAGGELALEGGRDLDLRATSNTVGIEGSLVLGATGAGDADALLGSVLMADAAEIGANSALTITIAATDNFGRIEAGQAMFGAGAAGETAGTLTINLDEGYRAVFGDRFLIVGSADVLGSGFASLLSGTLNGGLFFEQFVDATGVGVVVVPAPAGGALLCLGAAMGAGRRRRG